MKLRHLLFALSLFTAVAFSQDLNTISTTQTGSITAAGTDCNGVDCVWLSSPLNTAAVTFQLSGTFSATITFEASTTGAVWSSLSSATTTGSYSFSLSGKRYVRARCSAYTSGTVVVNIGSSTSGGGLSAVACVGTPGNTTGAYQQQCQTAAGAIYACNNAAGCTLAADWVAQGSGGSTFYFSGTVQAAATGFAFNLPAATAPTLTNGGGTVPIGVLEWPTAQSTFFAWVTFLLPSTYSANGALTFSLEYRSSDSTHAAILTPAIACQGTSATLDNPTFGNAPTTNLTAGASSDQTVTAGTWTPNTGSIPACAAGNRIWVKLTIDTNTNVMTGAFDLASFTIKL